MEEFQTTAVSEALPVGPITVIEDKDTKLSEGGELLDLKFWPETCLQRAALPVVEFNTPVLDKLIRSMALTLVAYKGYGLAAPQIGIMQRIIVLYDNNKKLSYMINPKILSSTDEIEPVEGCLSFPGVALKTKRASTVEVMYFDQLGEQQTTTCTGQQAVCLQHELDHLDGKTFLSFTSRLKKDIIVRKVAKVTKELARWTKQAKKVLPRG
jgi:peptide deformylase